MEIAVVRLDAYNRLLSLHPEQTLRWMAGGSMQLKKRSPHDPEVIAEVVEMIRHMTPEEALAFLTYRTPGIEETDMTGMLSNGQSPRKSASTKRHVAPK